MKRTSLFASWAPLLLGAFVGAAGAADSVTQTVGGLSITVTDLGLLPNGGTSAQAYAINNSGRIVGMATDAGFALHRVHWDAASGTIIGELPNLDPASTAVPEAINDHQEVAGTERIRSGLYYGVYWDMSGTVHALRPILGGLTTLVMAHGISNNGWIAGRSQEGAPNYYGHAVIWRSPDGDPLDLGFLGTGNYSEAHDVNDLGQVVGVANNGGASLGFLWREGQGYTNLGSLTGPTTGASIAHAVNNTGTIVGTSNGGYLPVMWTYDPNDPNSPAQIHELPRPTDMISAVAVAVNDLGDIAGYGAPSMGIGNRAVLWRNGAAINLGTWPGGTTSLARDINNDGQIVGEGNLAPDGYVHALMWAVAPTGGGGGGGDGGGGAANTSPSVTLTALTSTSIKLGRSVTVAGAFSDPDQGPWSYAFAWGDGASATGTAFTDGSLDPQTHVYTQRGAYKVGLTVTDAGGLTGVSHTVTVRVK